MDQAEFFNLAQLEYDRFKDPRSQQSAEPKTGHELYEAYRAEDANLLLDYANEAENDRQQLNDDLDVLESSLSIHSSMSEDDRREALKGILKVMAIGLITVSMINYRSDGTVSARRSRYKGDARVVWRCCWR